MKSNTYFLAWSFFTPLAALFLTATAFAADDLKLWYDKPAATWEQQALPIGNGRLGAMIFGSVPEEHIQFNEESLWIGDEQNTWAYQNFGDVFVKLDHGPVSNYRRELNLSNAIHTVSYESMGVKFRRIAFASAASKVMVFRFSADRPSSLSGSVTLADAHKGEIAAKLETDRFYVPKSNSLTATGNLAGYKYEGNRPYKLALNYESRVRVRHVGGTSEADRQKVAFKNVDELTLLLDAGTDFIQDRSKGWRGELPHEAITARLNKAEGADNGANLEIVHAKRYQTLFDRVSLDLGGNDPAKSALPTSRPRGRTTVWKPCSSNMAAIC